MRHTKPEITRLDGLIRTKHKAPTISDQGLDGGYLLQDQQLFARYIISSLDAIEVHSTCKSITTEYSLVIACLLLFVHELYYLLAECVVYNQCHLR